MIFQSREFSDKNFSGVKARIKEKWSVRLMPTFDF